jgi:uncharacterized protein
MTHLTYLLNRTGLWLVALALAACTVLAPIPDKTRYFLLTAMPPGEAGAQVNQANTSGLVLGLGPIRMPDYLERDEIVVRAESNQVRVSQDDHWAEPLKDNFTRVLSQNLSTLLGTQQIVNFPWYSSTHIDYQVAVTVDRFECDAQGNARLAARWSINNPVSGRSLDHGQADQSAACGGTIDQAVGALSQTLAALSRQLATAVAKVSAAQRPR